MARRSNIKKITDLYSGLAKPAQEAIMGVLEQMAISQADEDISDIDTSTRSEKRRARSAAKEDAKPARRSRKSADADEKPTRGRRAKAEAEDDAEDKPKRTRRVKVAAFEGEVTVDDLFDELDNFEGEPVEGTIRDLKPQVEEYGVDIKALYEMAEEAAGEKLSSSDKATELGVMLAACQHLEAKIIATLKEDEDAMEDVIEELDLELSERARGKTIAKAILVAINSDDGEDEPEEDEDDADEKPTRGRRAKAEAEDDERPARSSRRKSRKSDDDDLSDLDDLD